MRTKLLLPLVFGLLMFGNFAAMAGDKEITVYKSPLCGCCTGWVEHMRENGFSVAVRNQDDLGPIKKLYGIPEQLQSCHTATIDGYTIEGHVPASDVLRLLAERPKANGLAVPGMPIGSPGMEQGNEKEAYPVVLFSEDEMFVYANH